MGIWQVNLRRVILRDQVSGLLIKQITKIMKMILIMMTIAAVKILMCLQNLFKVHRN